MRRLPLRSPPRVRGKALHAELACFRVGITPAYAGKSCSSWLRCSRCGDHPRVCGEKSAGQAWVHPARGSPPRMRGKADIAVSLNGLEGITPAYAGKSFSSRLKVFPIWDHPRVCGEKNGICRAKVPHLGSPLRVRGKEPHREVNDARSGITPAYAGKRHSAARRWCRSGDHPRVCGEKQMLSCCPP